MTPLLIVKEAALLKPTPRSPLPLGLLAKSTSTVTFWPDCWNVNVWLTLAVELNVRLMSLTKLWVLIVPVPVNRVGEA